MPNRREKMDSIPVVARLACLTSLAVLAWHLVIPEKGESFIRRLFWWPLAALVIVPLGAELASAVALAFDEPLRLAPFSWVDRPLYAAQVITACAVVGGGWSYGVACLSAALLSRVARAKCA